MNALLRDLAARDRAVERAIRDQRAREARRPSGAPVRCKKCGDDDYRVCDCTLVRMFCEE